MQQKLPVSTDTQFKNTRQQMHTHRHAYALALQPTDSKALLKIGINALSALPMRSDRLYLPSIVGIIPIPTDLLLTPDLVRRARRRHER